MDSKSNKDNWGENFSEKEFEFKEEFWQEAEVLLQEDQKKSWIKRISIVLSLLLFLGAWTWWANDTVQFIQKNEQLSLLPTIVDTSDQLRAENFRNEFFATKVPFPIEDFKHDDILESLTQLRVSQAKQVELPPSASNKISFQKIRNYGAVNEFIVANTTTKKTSESETLYSLSKLNGLVLEHSNFSKSLITSQIELPDPMKKELPIIKRSRWSFEGRTGVNVSNHQLPNEWSQNFGGAVVFKPINKKNISLDVGIGLKSLQFHGLDSSFNHKTYDFGSKSRITDVTFNRSFYIYLPLQLNWHYKRHTFTSGVNVGYNILTETSLETRKVEFKTQNSQIEQEIDRNYGIRDGINNLLTEVSLSYSYSLSRQFDIGASIQFGLNDISNNQFWMNEQTDRLISTDFTLRYHFKTDK